MKLIEKNKPDILIGFLFIESLLLSLLVTNMSSFWVLYVFSILTVVFYLILKLGISPKELLEDKRKYDVFAAVMMTAMLNANISVLSNRLILIVILVAYYLGFRFVVGTFEKESLNQIEKNALNLSVLLTIFLGGNLITNLAIIVEKGTGFVVLAGSVLLFMFVYLLSFYNFVKNKVAKKWAKVYAVVLALVLSEISLLSGFYLEKYPNLYKSDSASGIAITTASLFMVVIYYMLYGLLIHKVEKRLYPKLILEYLAISGVIIVTLFITIKWFA